ncbi:hypothetical protein CK203_026625 [Vitis vinifera]|uniref:Uncharacterized protein n=1 Tax=Vitis vinifera TaxID=29760 RepID=A0A438IU42_VITVI|nr:hypothetical protein CK203_026625 [Vitis vinifera]
MTNDIGENFLLYGTTKEIWDAAKETYSNNENTSELFEVESVLHDFRQGELTVTQYFNTLNRYWQQLDLFEEHNWSCPGDESALAVRGNPSNNNDHRPKKGHHGVIIADVLVTPRTPAGRFTANLQIGSLLSLPMTKKDGATLSPWMKNHHLTPPFSKENRSLTEIVQPILACTCPPVVGISSLAQKVLDSGKMIGSAKMCSGLYLLEVNDPPQGATHHLIVQCPVVLFLCLLTWVFLMKEKSEANQIFKTFNTMIQTQFQAKIQILKTDNAKEYFNSILNDYLLSHGIVHQSSCVNTPQQNAILTAAYLINRMPSRILDFQTPCQILLQSFPNTHLISTIHSKFSGAQLLSMSINNTGTNLILELLNVFSLGTLQLKKDISATHRSLNSSITPWMSPSLSNNLISPNLIFRETNFIQEYQLWDIEESSHFSPNSDQPAHH